MAEGKTRRAVVVGGAITAGLAFAACSSATSERLPAASALERVERLVGEARESRELALETPDCALGDPADLLSNDPELVDMLSQEASETWAWDSADVNAIYSIPRLDLELVTCALGVPSRTRTFIRLEVRPAAQSIESFLSATEADDGFDVRFGDDRYGGTLYHYCVSRAGETQFVCASGWRDEHLDVAVSLNSWDPAIAAQLDETAVVAVVEQVVRALAASADSGV